MHPCLGILNCTVNITFAKKEKIIVKTMGYFWIVFLGVGKVNNIANNLLPFPPNIE